MPDAHVPCEREHTENECQQHRKTLGNDQKPAAIDAICDHTAWERKNHHRQSAEETRQSELKRRIRNLINLPSDRDGGDLCSYRRKEQACPEESEISLGENLPGCDFLFHRVRSEEHTSELQSRLHLVCRL